MPKAGHQNPLEKWSIYRRNGRSINIRVVLAIILLLSFSMLLSSCQNIGNVMGSGEMKISNINIFKGTPAWKLAVAVNDQKTDAIEKIVKQQPELLNYQEPRYGATLLLWAVGMEKYQSAATLLKCGADPNIAATKKGGETPLFVAAGFSWIDNEYKKDPKYVKLLLSYGANPNKTYIGGDPKNTVTEPGTSPLMESIRCGIEKTKALVEGGTDLNYKTPSGETAAIDALMAGWNSTLEGMEYAHYLIVEKKAKVSDPYFGLDLHGQVDLNNKLYPVDLLRNWVYDLDSKQYQTKMEIVAEFSRQGVNYRDSKINKYTLQQIQKLYPDTWTEYIKKY